ncbi:MAG: hypothetical protein INQ03_17955 [Candidatus Heimdallarchaeota archaeon]|nr:hypothetical protein [Candidatus Heimdallarchaeota archaeon]
MSELAKKTIRIRDVNKDLYDHFRRLAEGIMEKNVGEIFSRMLSHYQRDRLPPGHKPRKGPMHNKKSLFDLEKVEFICNHPELTVSKKDLLAIPNSRYAFRKIERLVFDESVDNKAIMDHVLYIKDCGVEFNAKFNQELSKLFVLSTTSNRSLELYPNAETKDITIRDVEIEIYESFVKKVTIEGITTGQAVNKLLNIFVSRLDEHHQIIQLASEPGIKPETIAKLIVVSLLEEVIVTSKDLDDIMDRTVFFYRINRLVFTDNISAELFREKVSGIYACAEIIFPDNIPKLIQYTRIKR